MKAVNAMKADRLQALSPVARREVIEELSDEETNVILHDWEFWARPAQLAPTGDWVNWLILAGRGFGKTRVGAEQVRRWTREFPIVSTPSDNVVAPVYVLLPVSTTVFVPFTVTEPEPDMTPP